MKVVSWNVWANRGADTPRLDRLVDALAVQKPDIAVLQEVATVQDLPARLREALGRIGLIHSVYGDPGDAREKRYGNLIASRLPVRARPWSSKRWPQLAVAADVDVAGGLTVVGAHIPNGSGNGWKKVEALETLAAGLRELGAEHPTVVAGDFNEPAAFTADGGVRSWRAQLHETLDGNFDDGLGELGSVRPRREWQSAVEAVLARGAPHGLRHVWFDRHPDVPMPATHVTRGDGERYFDHILVSKHFSVKDAGFDHAVRAKGARTSDHSLAWAEIERRVNSDHGSAT